MDQRTPSNEAADTHARTPLETTAAEREATALPSGAGFGVAQTLNQRRWKLFKRHRRGYVSLWIFAFLFVLTLFAEFIANDKPLIVSYKGEILVPVLVDYPEEKFGGFLARDRLSRPLHPRRDRRQRLDDLAADPVRLPRRQHLAADAAARRPLVAVHQGGALRAVPGGRQRSQVLDLELELAGHRRSGAGRSCPRHLRLPHLGPLRPRADGRLLGDRHRRRCGAGLFRRLDRPSVPALHRDLDLDPDALHHPDPRRRCSRPTSSCCSASSSSSRGWRSSASCAPNSCARAISSTWRRRRRWGSATSPSCGATCSPTRWWRRSPSCPSS